MLDNPASVLVDYNGFPLFTSQSQDLSGSITSGVMLAGSGSDGKGYLLQTSPSGHLFITGSVASTAIMSPNTPVSQGLPGGIPDSWNVKITDGTNVIGTSMSNPIYVSGAVDVIYNTNPGATVTSVLSSATVITLLSASTGNRRGVMMFYNGTKNLFVKLGTGASLTSFSFRMAAKSYYELPFNYTGIITGIWDSAGGADNFVNITEITD